MGADFLKKQLAKQPHDYTNTVVDCAVSILEQYAKEGHLNHSIAYFHNQFKYWIVRAYREGQTTSEGWVPTLQGMNVVLGGGRHEERAIKDFWTRVGFLDKYLITTAQEIDAIFELVDMGVWFKPIITKSVFNKDNYKLDTKLKPHVESTRFRWNEEDESVTIDDAAIFTQDGSTWYTSGRSSMRTKGNWYPEQPYRLFVNADGWPADMKRTTDEGKFVRDVFGVKYRIGKQVKHPDPMQPYFELYPVSDIKATPQDMTLVSYSALMRMYDELDEHVKIPYPVFCIWPSDVQEV